MAVVLFEHFSIEWNSRGRDPGKEVEIMSKSGNLREMQEKVCLHGNHQSVLLLFPVDMPLTTLD